MTLVPNGRYFNCNEMRIHFPSVAKTSFVQCSCAGRGTLKQNPEYRYAVQVPLNQLYIRCFLYEIFHVNVVCKSAKAITFSSCHMFVLADDGKYKDMQWK